MSVPSKIANNQTKGNIGLFYVCYRLARLGWNVMPTARNARGVDVLIYNEDSSRKLTIQIKALSKAGEVRLGDNLYHLCADFVLICRHVLRETEGPECFILTSEEVRQFAKEQQGKFYLHPRRYGTEQFREKWERIGEGVVPPPRCTGPAIRRIV
jgi:hypothetical protein